MKYIGTIQIGTYQATYDLENGWICDSEVLQELLNGVYAPASFPPGDGWPGHKLIHGTAKALNGTVIDEVPTPTSPAGTTH